MCSPSKFKNCLGLLALDAGQDRVPLPPHKITGKIFLLSIGEDPREFIEIVGTILRVFEKVKQHFYIESYSKVSFSKWPKIGWAKASRRDYILEQCALFQIL